MFSVSALKAKMEHVFQEHGQGLVQVLKQYADGRQTIDLQNLFQCFTFDTMCEIAFGDAPNAVQMAARGGKPEFLVSFGDGHTVALKCECIADFAQTISVCRMLLPPKLWKVSPWSHSPHRCAVLSLGRSGQ